MKSIEVLRTCGFIQYQKVTDTGVHTLFGKNAILLTKQNKTKTKAGE